MVRGVKFERNGAVRLVPVNKNYDEDIVSKEDAPYVLNFCGVAVREQSVLLDSSVAELYGVETKRVNEAVGNNPDKFPEGYIIALSS